MNGRDGLATGFTPRKLIRAFTVLELMVVVLLVAIIAALILPALIPARQRPNHMSCIADLKQIGICFRIWADDNNNLYPMQFYTNASGQPLFVGTNVYRYFQTMSNELNTPKIVVCPADSARPSATNFLSDFNNNSRVSFFVGLDADESHPRMLLAGDRNITNGTPLQNGVLTLTGTTPEGWTRQIHNRLGNILLSDGSVQQTSDAQLNALVSATGTNLVRLAIP
jgi:Tfp pilus assembly protein PilE